MLIPDDDTFESFKCPSDLCDFRARTIKKVQMHCLQDCPEKLVYLAMKDRHDNKPKCFKILNKRADLGHPVRLLCNQMFYPLQSRALPTELRSDYNYVKVV